MSSRNMGEVPQGISSSSRIESVTDNCDYTIEKLPFKEFIVI
jgi:hypothetical protein